MRPSKITTAGLLAAATLWACAPTEQPVCDYGCVDSLVRQYVAQMVQHDPTGILFAADVRITENGQEVAVGEGVWQTITEQGGYHQVLIDDGLQDATFFGAFQEGDEPLLLAIRLRLEGGEITEVENLVSRYDERNRLIARHELSEPNAVFDQLVPEG